MADTDVIQRGADTSGRKLLASRFMWAWWDAVCDELGFEPTIVQGAWMSRAGGGAAASAGYHDGGGCFDLRVWNLTSDQVERTIRTLRRAGAGAWVRDSRHGMDPHIHFVIGDDYGLASGATYQWGEYVAGRSGLSSRGRDYHWRPSPLVVDAGGWLRSRKPAPTPVERKAAARKAKGHDLASDLDPIIRGARSGRHRFPAVARALGKARAALRGKRETKEGA